MTIKVGSELSQLGGYVKKENMRRMWIFVVSAAGIISGIAGTVAIFFPDLLNLQKSTMATFERELVSRSDVEDFDAFLIANSGKLVSIKLSICRSGEPEWLLKNDEGLVVVHEECLEGSCTTTDYRILEPDLPSHMEGIWGNEKFAPCKNDENGGLWVMGGYFMVPDAPGFGQGNLEWFLRGIPARDVKLMSY
jgi:hypothetical protein